MFPEILVDDIKWELHRWLATFVSLTNNFINLFDRLLPKCPAYEPHEPHII